MHDHFHRVSPLKDQNITIIIASLWETKGKRLMLGERSLIIRHEQSGELTH